MKADSTVRTVMVGATARAEKVIKTSLLHVCLVKYFEHMHHSQGQYVSAQDLPMPRGLGGSSSASRILKFQESSSSSNIHFL